MNEIGGVYRSQSKQWLAALAATLAMVNVGNEEFWLAKTFLNFHQTDFASKQEKHYHLAGFLVAATSSVIGTILGAVLADRFGRRTTLLATSIFAIIQSFGGISTNCVFSCITLFLGEIGLGITRVVVPLYVSEIVDDNIRGTLLMLQVPFFYVGKLVAVGVGNAVSTEVVGVLSLILTAIFLLTFTRFPETPYYLALKKKNEAASKSLTFFRGIESIAAEDDIEAIITDVEVADDSQRADGKFKELIRPTNRKALLIIMFLIIIKWSEQICDSQNYIVYVVLGTVVSKHYHARIIAHATSLIASLLILLIIDIIGRRSLLTYSTFLGFILVIIALILGGNPNNEWVYNAIGMTLHLCVLIIFSVPLVYAGELFSAKVKSVAIAIVTAFNLLLSFVIIMLPETFEGMVHGFISLIIILFAFPITFAFVPETKRKSFSDIQIELAKTSHCRCSKKKLIHIEQFK